MNTFRLFSLSMIVALLAVTACSKKEEKAQVAQTELTAPQEMPKDNTGFKAEAKAEEQTSAPPAAAAQAISNAESVQEAKK